MYIYISSSWKNRIIVRSIAKKLRNYNHQVYDFTDPKCRSTREIPPEAFPITFNPEKYKYYEYLNRNPEWKLAVEENRRIITICDIILLLLPCGIDATADWALGVGLGKKSIIVGHPRDGERSPVHLWADIMVEEIDDAIEWINSL